MDSPGLIVLIVVGVPALLALIWFVASYNRFIRVRQHIRESWADVDVELKRRHDLIPNLVETVRGYAGHERQVLESVVVLRNKAAGEHVSPAALAQDESALMLGLKRLFAVVEGYPALKADRNFLALQEELANTEDRIAAARRFFNGNVREFNQLCGMFPANMIAGMFRFTPASFFELSAEAERVVPRVFVSTFTQPAAEG